VPKRGLKSRRHLFPEDGLRLATKSLLFSVVTPSALGRMTFLRLLVLCHFVGLMLLAFFAIGASRLRDVHLKIMTCVRRSGKYEAFVYVRFSLVKTWLSFNYSNNIKTRMLRNGLTTVLKQIDQCGGQMNRDKICISA